MIRSKLRTARRVRWAAIGSSALLLGVGALAYAAFSPKFRTAPDPNFAASTSQLEAMQQDLQYFSNFRDLNRSFTRAQLLAFDGELQEIATELPSLAWPQFEARISRAVALADEGHARVRGVAYGLSMNSLPLRVNWFAEGLFVTSALAPWEVLLGQEVILIEGHDPEVLVERLGTQIGGADSLRRELSPRLLVSPDLLHAYGIGSSPTGMRMTLSGADGFTSEFYVEASTGPAHGDIKQGEPWRTMYNNRWPHRDLSPVPFPGDLRLWKHILEDEGVALSLRNPETYYWDQDLENDASFLQLNAIRDQDGRLGLETYLAEYLEQLSRKGIQTVIIDLRANAGGNGELTVDFAKGLPEVIGRDGRIFVLTGGNTFSAAIVTAARIKYFGGGNVVLLGEPMGDTAQFWAEGRSFKLPNSKLEVQWTVSYHDWENGCSLLQMLICHPLNYVTGVAAGSLAPDVAVEQTYADYRLGRDGALAKIADLTGLALLELPLVTDHTTHASQTSTAAGRTE